MNLPDYPVTDEPVRASWGRQLLDFIRSRQILSGPDIEVRSTTAGTHLRIRRRREEPRVSPTFSGRAYVAGKKTEGLSSDGTKVYVKCVRDTRSASEETGPPPDPWPGNEEWYDKRQTFGDIHAFVSG